MIFAWYSKVPSETLWYHGSTMVQFQKTLIIYIIIFVSSDISLQKHNVNSKQYLAYVPWYYLIIIAIYHGILMIVKRKIQY